MKYEQSIDIDAPPHRVWSVMSDVERWPEWTQSITRAELVSSRPFGAGSRVRVKQPRLMAVTWTVTEFEPDAGFSWRAVVPGLTSDGLHRITPRREGGSTVTLTLDQRGPLAPVLRLLTAKLTRRYIDFEARGLKARSETNDGDGHQPRIDAAAGQ